MSYRSRFLQSSAYKTPLRPQIVESWGSASVDASANSEGISSQDTNLLPFWRDADAMGQTGFEPRRIKWGAVLGMALATGVSVSIWTGIVLLIARIWK